MAEAGKALHLIYANEETGKFELGADALAAITAIRGPVAVCAVCGRARQGKSFILNKLAHTNAGEGFVVGPTHRPCTKGIWIWSSPLEMTAVDGSKYSMLLIDTEGIDAYDQTGQYSTQIFSLAVLLSSLFLYNQMGGIDEAALDRLSLVTEMSKHIAIKADASEEENKKELGSFSPSFIWLLRDFYLDLEEDGQEVTAKDYLEMALRNHVGSGPGVESKNLIRDSIRALFPERECVTLVRPCNDERMLQKLNTVSMEDLRPEFTEGLHFLIDLINHRCQPKKVGNDVLNGPALGAIAQAYITAINDGAVPEIQTAWQNVAEAECRRVMEDAEGIYVKEFPALADPCPPEDAPLLAAHNKALKLAVAAFEADAVGGISIRTAHVAKLEESAMRRFEEYKSARFAEASKKANELAGAIMDDVTVASEDPDQPVSSVLTALDTGVTRFLDEAAGPEKCPLLAGLVKRAMAGPVKTAHGAEVTAGEIREEALRAEGEKAVAAVELQLEAAKTDAAHAATEAAKRESDLKQQSAEELAASEKRASDAAQEAAKVLQETQEKAHEQQVADAEKLAASEKAAQEKYSDLERKAHDEATAAANELTAAKTAAAKEATEAAKRESDLKVKATEDLAAAVKEGADKLAAREKEANEADKAAAKALSEAQEKARQEQATAAANLAAAEKKAQEEKQQQNDRYGELERKAFEQEKASAQELAALKAESATELAASEKAASEAQAALEKKLAETSADLSAQLSANQQAASMAAAEAASALAEAEKQALEDVGAMDEKLRVAKEEMEEEVARLKQAAEQEKQQIQEESESKLQEAQEYFEAQLTEAKASSEEAIAAAKRQAESDVQAATEAAEEQVAAAKAAEDALEDKLFAEKKAREKRENEFAHELGHCHEELMAAQEVLLPTITLCDIMRALIRILDWKALRAVMMKNEKLYTDNFTMREQLDSLLAKPERKGFREMMKGTFSGFWGPQGGPTEGEGGLTDGKPLPGDQYNPAETPAGAPPQGSSVPPVPAAENIQAYVVRGGGQPGAQPQP